jgi:hypothetical protein
MTTDEMRVRRIEKLEGALDALFRAAHHAPECPSNWRAPCCCGLSAALDKARPWLPRPASPSSDTEAGR